jgi:hypothetical protein
MEHSTLYPMIFIEDHGFEKRRKGLLEDDEFFELLEWLAVHPDAGKIIPGSGGLRKVRWAGKGRGKRGGARVIYFWWIADDRLLLLDIYAKNEQENLSAAQMAKLKLKVIK